MENKHQDIENAVVNQLSKEGLTKDQLSNISKSIASLQRAGFQVIDWTMFGRPAFEKVVFETQLAADKTSAFQSLFGGSEFKEIFIYRKGVPPMPNFFQVQVGIANR